MPAAQAFKVLTEFKFEVGSALIGASSLEQGVNKVSDAAKGLQFQLARVGIGFGAQLGLVGGGALGLASNLIKQFNNIEKQQIKIGGIFYANRGFLSGINDANDALQQSDKFLLKIAKDAEKFGLNEGALANFSALSTAITAKEGISPTKNIEFGRNILKAAPQLGVNAFDAEGQIRRALLGGASGGDPAFSAITQETTAFKDFAKKVGGMTKVTKSFNKLPTVERFNLLNKALGQFTSNSELLAKQANTIDAKILRLKQGLFGLNGVFRPLAETIQGPVKEALDILLNIMQGKLRGVIKDISAITKILVPDLETAALRLHDLSNAAKSFKAASIGALFIGLLPFIKHFKFLGALFGGGALVKGLAVIGNVLRFVFSATILKFIGSALLFLGKSLIIFAKPLLILFTIFQLFSRAIGIAKIKDAEALPGIIANVTGVIAQLSAAFSIITAPLRTAFNAIAEFLSPLFRLTVLAGFVTDVFKDIGDAITGMLAIVQGVAGVIVGLFESISKGNFREIVDVDRQKEIFTFGVNSFLDEVLEKSGRGSPDGESAGPTTSNRITNVGKVEIKNNFKEQIEPDRIAFSLKDQLLKAAQNPTAARGRGFTPVGNR